MYEFNTLFYNDSDDSVDTDQPWSHDYAQRLPGKVGCLDTVLNERVHRETKHIVFMLCTKIPQNTN